MPFAVIGPVSPWERRKGSHTETPTPQAPCPPLRVMVSGSVPHKQFHCYFPPIRYVRNMHTDKAVESRHCMGCGERDWEESPHLRCRCGAQFCDHCIQAHCCSGVEASPRTARV
jgi:hypothetical protein